MNIGNKKILILTSAIHNEDHPDVIEPQVRIADYISSFAYAKQFAHLFDSIHIVEGIAKEPIDYLENSGIPVHYSKYPNNIELHDYKTTNEINHIWDFLKNDEIDDEDIIIKITGRYLLYDPTIILNKFNNNIDAIAKEDNDIYNYAGGKGFHTFLWAFRKKIFREFLEYSKSHNKQIEHLLKDFLIEKEKTIVLSEFEKIGCITCLWNKQPQKHGQMIMNFARYYV